MDKTKIALGLASVAIVIAIGGYFYPVAVETLGATGTRFPNGLSTTSTSPAAGQVLTTTLQVGTNGTNFAGVKTGSCTIWAPATTIAASTTQAVECQSATTGGISTITGVTTDSVCQLVAASTTSSVSNGIAVIGTSASSTAGTIVARLSNLTGATFTWTAEASSTPKWNYICLDPS